MTVLASRVIRPLLRAEKRLWVLTAALCAVFALLQVHGPDFPAAQFRAWLFREGALLVDGRWFAGHLLPGYSLLFPPLASVVGSGTVGIVSCVASTWLLTRIFHNDESLGAAGGRTVALLWFAVVTVADFVIGRLAFALGLAFGLAAVLAVQRRRPALAGLAAVAAALGSPLAGAFLVLVAVAWAPSIGWRRAAPLGGAVVGIGAAALFGADGGRFPFVWSNLLAILLFVAFGLALCPDEYPALRRGLALYGATAVLLFVVPNPIGGNLSRLGTLLAGPVAALVLLHIGKRRAFALLAGPLLFWQFQPVYGAVSDSVHDPSAQPAYYTGLLSFLAAHQYPIGRVEIPLTRNHWETSFVAAQVPLARGWERQLDTDYDGVLYQPTLTAAAYHEWLLSTGVRYVALPDVPLDTASAGEWRVLVSDPSWLTPVWHDAHWQVWALADPASLVHGPAVLSQLGVSSLSLNFNRAGSVVVLVHYTRFWRISGPGCVAPTADGWTRVWSPVAGPVQVTARLDLPSLDPLIAANCPVAG